MDHRIFKTTLALRFVAATVVLVLFANFGFGQSMLTANGQPVVGTRLVPGMLNERGEEVVSRASGFSAVLTLQDDNLATLIDTGRVEIEIPTQLINNVESVIIKRPLYFKEKRATGYGDTALNGRKLQVKIGNSVIERIDYQPVELKIYESNFTSVVLRYVGYAPSIGNGKVPGDPATDSPLLTVNLNSGKGIRGRIRGMKSLNIDSTLGKINVPFSRAAKIDVRKSGELIVEMSNGDRISGSVDGGEIQLLNRWGTETIQMSEISSLTVEQPTRNIQQVQRTAPVINTHPGLHQFHQSQQHFHQGQQRTQIYQPSTLNQGFSPAVRYPIR